MTVGRPLRAARAAVFAAVCVGLSAAGHVWMSGRGIPWWSAALALAVLGGLGYALAGRQRGLVPIAALMLAGEAAQHLLYTAAQGAAPATAMQRRAAETFAALPPSARRIPLGDWICGMPGMPGMAGMAGTSGMAGMDSGSLSARLAANLMAGHGIGMIAAHGAAGLLSAWWLWRGETAVFRMLRSAAALAFPLFTVLWPAIVPVPDFVRAGEPVGEGLPARALLVLSTAVVRRGPPHLRISL